MCSKICSCTTLDHRFINLFLSKLTQNNTLTGVRTNTQQSDFFGTQTFHKWKYSMGFDSGFLFHTHALKNIEWTAVRLTSSADGLIDLDSFLVNRSTVEGQVVGPDTKKGTKLHHPPIWGGTLSSFAGFYWQKHNHWRKYSARLTCWESVSLPAGRVVDAPSRSWTPPPDQCSAATKNEREKHIQTEEKQTTRADSGCALPLRLWTFKFAQNVAPTTSFPLVLNFLKLTQRSIES